MPFESLIAESGVLGFLALFAALYAASLTVLFATGATMVFLNRRHPERRIQKREPSHRAMDDIKSSTKQLSITSLCLAIGLFAQAKGWTIAPVALSWWSVPVFFVLSLILHDAWFYWGHRILHTKMFYRFHKPHHMTITPTVWSNDAGSSVDTLFAHSYYALVLFVIPIPPAVFLGHRLFDQVSAAIGHCGYEHFASASARKPWPLLCTLYHDQHHQYFVYNYANYFSFWDRLCGTIHPTYDGKVEGFEDLYAQHKLSERRDSA
ncbi:MAG: sterol desaturase family protein [Roseibium sp.]|nr:sterol desaturase family protein [Roseibium sp.]